MSNECKWPLCICPSRKDCQLKVAQASCVITQSNGVEQFNEGTRDTKEMSKTHTIFFDANILVETEKAFRIKVINRKGAQTTVWIPKSRCCAEICMRRTQAPPHDYVEFKKYYAPNFFIK